jgi:hypothetical protein
MFACSSSATHNEPAGLDGGVASLPCSHNSPVNCDYHPNTHCDKISLPLLAVWSSKNRVSGPFEDTILFKLSDDAVGNEILGLHPVELGIKAFKNTQSVAHGVDDRKNTLAIERTCRLVRHSEEFLRGVLCREPRRLRREAAGSGLLILKFAHHAKQIRHWSLIRILYCPRRALSGHLLESASRS